MSFPASMKRRRSGCTPPPPHNFGGVSMRAAGGGVAGTRAVLLGLVLAAGVLLAGAAGPARAFTVGSPAALYKDTLNGAQIVLSTATVNDWFPSATASVNKSFYTLQNVPNGVTLSISTITRASDQQSVTLTLNYTGDFTSDWNLSILVNFSAFYDTSNNQTFGPIPVRVAPLVVGAVSGQATEGGGTATFPVTLAGQPSAAVTVAVSSQDTSEGTVAPAALTFSTMTWNTAQTVTVTGMDDTLADGDVTWNVRLASSSTDNDYNGRTRMVSVTTANDDAGLAVDPTTLMLTEEDATAGSGTYTVALVTLPSGPVTVTATSGDAAVTVAPTALTYSATTWNTAQTVTATAVHDDDGVGETVTVSHTATSSDASYTIASARAAESVTVTVTDNDTIGVVVDTDPGTPGVQTATLSVTEDGTMTTDTYTVVLATEPTGPVTVTVSDDTTTTVGVNDLDKVSAAPGALTFTTTSWDTAQTVTVAGRDDTDGANEAVSLAHVATSGDAGYAGVTIAAVAVSVTDDDAAIVLSATSLTVTEGTSPTATYTVALGVQPTGGVEVLVSRGNPGYVLNKVGGTQAASQTLTFTTSTWNTGQAITVVALDDTNTAGGTSNITHTTVDANTATEYDPVSKNLPVTLIDDEATIAVSRGTGALALTEGGNATYTVTLAGQPTGAVVVDVTSDDAGAAAVAPAALTYSATTWNTGQTVTVSAVSDADSDAETVTVTHAVNDGASANEFDPAPDVTFTVNVTDNTPYRGEFDSGHGGSTISIAPAELFAVVGPQLLTISSTQATFFNPYTVHLCPFTSVPRSTGASVNGCTTIANRAATNRIDWNVSVTQAMVTNGGFVVMVKQAVAFQLVIYANWVPLVTPRTPTLVLAPTSITENGGVSTVTATLSSAPTAAVTLTVGAAAVSPAVAGDFTLSAGATLTFATGATASTGVVTLTAADNAVDAADKRVTVTGSVASPDRRVINPAAATLTITDDDTAGVAVDTDPGTPGVQTAALSVTEDGTTTTATYTVVLGTEPTGPVTITVTSGDAAVAIDTDATPQTRTLTFSPTSWDTAQTVTVAGRDDVDGDNEAVSLAHVATSGDAGYAGFTIAAVTVNVADDDAPGFLVSPTGLALTEGASGSYTLRLNSQPSGPVTVAVVTPTNTDVTRAPGSLTFAAGAWNTAQTVTVSVASDTDGLNETATVTHTATSSDSNYTIATARPAEHVTVTVTDNDTPGLAVTPTTLALTEEHATDGSGTYTVVLGTEPSAPVTVTIASDDEVAVSRAPAALTFGTTDWATAQTVVATAVADADAVDERVALTHTLTGAAEYAGSAGPPVVAAVTVADVVVTVEDDEEQGLTLTPPAVTVAEDGAATNTAPTYTVVLDSEPTAPVVVRIGSDNTDVHAMPGLLQYTASSWNTAQTVTVRADADADGQADVATLTHTAAGGDYTGLAAETLGVTVTDNDAGVEVSRRALTVVEGRTNTYTVVLAAAPAGPVTVTATSSDTNVALVGPTQNPASRAVVFTAGTWQTAQAVPVTGMGAGTATLSHVVSGYGSVVSAASVAVGVVGPGTGFVRIVPQAVTVLEGASGTYTVGLGTEPTGPVTVTVGAPSNTDSAITRAPGALTFDATSWGTAQAVTVTAGTDAGTTEGSATIAHTVTGYGSVTSGPDVTVTEDEDATPTLGAVAPQTYRAGQAVSVRLPGATVGSGNPPLRYALTGPLPATDLTLPAGLAFAAATRRLQGTPGAAAAAATYRLTVTDVNGSTATQDFTLTVAANPLPGFAAAVPFMRHPLNQAAAQTLPAPTVTGTPVLTFVVTPALPAGLTYEPPARDAMTNLYPHGGRIVGTPTAPTPQRQYTLTVVDAQGNEAAVTFALATGAAPAAPGPTDRQPRFGNATVEPQRYTVGTAVTLTLPAATNGDGRLTYTLTPPALPAGLTYTPPAAGATTGGTLAGTPTAVHPMTTYTLTATDADGDPATLAFTVEVGAAGAIRPQEGTQTYTVNGQQVTVTQTPGTLAGIALTVTEPARLDGAVTITLAPPGADVPLVRGGYGFGPAGARAVVALTVAPVPAGGLRVCLPVPAEVRTAAGARALVLVRYTGQQWEPVAGAEDAAAAGQVCAAGVTTFGPLGVGYANRVPTFEDRTVGALAFQVNEAHAVPLPAATGGDGAVRYTLTPPALPAGLTYTPPAAGAATGGVIAGTPAAETAARAYTLTATDVDGDTATLAFTVEVVRTPVRVTVTDGSAMEGRPVEFAVTLSRAAGGPLTLGWTAGRPGSATPGEDYEAVAAGQVTVAAGATAGRLVVRTLDDRRVEPVETFTVTVTLPAETSVELAQGTAVGRIEDDDTEQARQRSLGMVLAGVGRTLATDAVDVIGDRFVRHPSAAQATVGGQAVDLERGPQRNRWRHAAGVAYGVARALGVEVGSPLEGGDGQFGQVRGAAWSTLTRHLRDPHAPTPPLSAWDAPGAFAGAPGPGWGGPSAGWGTAGLAGGSPTIPPPSGRGLEPAPDLIRGGGSSAGHRLASGLPFGHAALPGLAGYGPGLGQLGFDRAHAATPQAVQVGAFRAPVQFRRVSGAEVLSQSEFEVPLSGPTSPADPPPAASVAEADPAATDPLVEPAAQAAAATWTLWGRGTASGFNGKPKDDFSMDGNVFTGYLGVDYRLQPNVLVGLAVAHSQGDVDYETTDVTKGDVDVTLTSVLPYAHWSPRPGLGVWGLFGAGWGDLKLRDEAGKVKTDLEMLLGAVGARQEVLTWRQIDVALKADAFLTELEAGSDDRLPKTAGDAQRLRLMVEGRTAWAVSEDSHLTPVFEVGGRWDGGKAETGVGAEMGGGFEYAHTKLGLGVEARGRYLLAHQKSAFDEWGASLTLRLDPGADKRGLWLALAPVWGAEASQVEQMWGSADVLRAGAESDTQPGLSPAQVEFDLGYGMVTHEGAGLLTTYGGLSMLGPGSHGVRLGGRLALGEWIDLSVEGERTTQGGGAEHQVALYGHLGW